MAEVTEGRVVRGEGTCTTDLTMPGADGRMGYAAGRTHSSW